MHQEPSPQLHDAGDVAWWVDAADVVEISHVQASVDAPRQSHRRQQFVAQGLAVAAGARDAPAPAISHHCGNDRRLQRDELVLPAAFVQNTCHTNSRTQVSFGHETELYNPVPLH